jgi:hypothetical protein
LLDALPCTNAFDGIDDPLSGKVERAQLRINGV